MTVRETVEKNPGHNLARDLRSPDVSRHFRHVRCPACLIGELYTKGEIYRSDSGEWRVFCRNCKFDGNADDCGNAGREWARQQAIKQREGNVAVRSNQTATGTKIYTGPIVHRICPE